MDKRTQQAIDEAVSKALERQLEERLIDVQCLANRLGISRSMAYRLIYAGEIPVIRINTAIRVKNSDVNAYINRLTDESRKASVEGE